MAERSITPRLTDIVEAIDHIRDVLEGVPLETFERTGKSDGWSSAELK